jgi:hypothetical protein
MQTVTKILAGKRVNAKRGDIHAIPLLPADRTSHSDRRKARR